MTRAHPRSRARPPRSPSTTSTSGSTASRRRRTSCASASREADGLLTLLTDPVDADAARRRPGPAGDREHGGRHGQHRPRGGDRARHPGRQHARRADRRHRRPRVRAAARARPPDRPRASARCARASWVHVGARRTRSARDLAGATLGIVGCGRIGQAVARRAEGFGMEVLHSSRRSGVPLEELLERADFVSLHCPLTPETRHLIGADALARMKPTALPRQHRARRRSSTRPRCERALHERRDRRRRARRHRPRAAARRRPAARGAEPARRPARRLGHRPHARADGRDGGRQPARRARRRADAAPGRLTPRRRRRHRHELDAAADRRRRRRRRRGARARARSSRGSARASTRTGRLGDAPQQRVLDVLERLRARRSSAHGCERARRRDDLGGARRGQRRRVRRARARRASGSTRAR